MPTLLHGLAKAEIPLAVLREGTQSEQHFTGRAGVWWGGEGEGGGKEGEEVETVGSGGVGNW